MGHGLRRILLPSLEVSKGFLNVPLGKCSFDRCTNLGCPGGSIRLQRGPYLPLHCACCRLAQSTSLMKHGAVADDALCVIQDPVALLPTFWLGLLAREFQCFKVAGQFIVRLGWELQGEALMLPTVCHQPSSPPCVEGGNSCVMVRIVDQRHLKSNLLEITNIPLPCQNVIRLSVVPSPHLLLMPRPSILGCLHLALQVDKISERHQ
jgi:hypothetical protein